MAKYVVQWACGHETTEQLFGKERDRQAWIRGAATRLCPDCLAAKRKTEAEAIQAESGLPELKGSEKQVVWATRIRADVLKEVDELRQKFERALTEAARSKFLEIFDSWADGLKATTSASWWIDNRDMPVKHRFETDKKDELSALAKSLKEGNQ
jgi:hypothetical protein